MLEIAVRVLCQSAARQILLHILFQTALSSPGIKKHATTDLLRNFSTLSSGQTQQRATQVDTQVHQNLSSVVKLRMKELVRNLSQFWLYQALFPKEYVPCFKQIWKKMVVSAKDFVG